MRICEPLGISNVPLGAKFTVIKSLIARTS